ncbi:MAG: hypothetical protein R3B41_03115 [Candidatus Doudnabacteria bacterium]
MLKLNEGYKTPAAFLLQICGLTDMTIGGARINSAQPAVILNDSGEATASEVLALFVKVRDLVFEMTGVYLRHEPNLIGFTEPELELLQLR